MTTRERREEYSSSSSSNVVRSLHPTRPLSPNNTSSEFDNNLDYLLDDLQTSVARPGVSPIQDTHYSRDVEYLSPTNSTTIIKERSISPSGGQRNKILKTSHYEYKTTSNSNDVQPLSPPQLDAKTNINQLDSLLLDLKHERDSSRDRVDHSNFSNVGIDSGLLEPSGGGSTITKTIKTYSTTSNTAGGGGGGVKSYVNRELLFDEPSLNNQSTITSSTTTNRQSRQNQKSPSYQKNVESQILRDVTYDSDPSLSIDNTLSSTSKQQRSYNYSKTNDQQIVPYQDIVEVDTSHLPAELKGVPLSNDILPGPGTKVTTTIKTFTYEIPGEPQPQVPTNKTFTYKNEFYNTLNTSENGYQQPEHDIPSHINNTLPGGNKTIIYKNETYNTINKTDGYPSNGHGPVRSSPMPTHHEPITNKTYMYKKDASETTTNVYPPYDGRPNGPQPHITTSPPIENTTVIYKQDITNTNTNTHHPPPFDTNIRHPPHQPGQPAPKQTYMYKRETTNTTNTMYGPPGGGRQSPYPNENYPPSNALPPPPSNSGYPNDPNPMGSSYTKYSTHTTTRNTHGAPPPEHQPLLAAPFPTDGVEITQVDGYPPKRLDDLLANFDDNGRPVHDEPYTPRKEVNTALTTNKSVAIVDPKPTTKNIAGPPVYYPPGHELFAKNEQSAAAWRAQGGYAKGRGEYEYESGSKSKSSSKSGGAMVPVCLPLCCAMPCVIM